MPNYLTREQQRSNQKHIVSISKIPTYKHLHKLFVINAEFFSFKSHINNNEFISF